jgi:hypothetical protein
MTPLNFNITWATRRRLQMTVLVADWRGGPLEFRYVDPA